MSAKRRSGREPDQAVGRSPGIDRRDFLRIAGLGAGTLVVAGAAGLTWRAVDGGVFATGTGPAYAAWDTAGLAGGDGLALVRNAVLAANAHNAQPWTFRLATDGIDVFADTSRGLGAMDPLEREMHVSLGCAVENLAVAASAAGRTATVTWLPSPGDPTHVARVDLAATVDPPSTLGSAIASRNTRRGPYDTRRTLAQGQLDALGSLADGRDVEVVWWTQDAPMTTFGDLTVRATEAIIADEQQAADDFAWYRTSWSEIQLRKDGITIDPSGQTPLVRALAKLVPVSRVQNNAGWLRGTRDSQVPTAAAFGALVVDDAHDPLRGLQAGRVWQRLALEATRAGVGVQPLCQVLERIDREAELGLPPDITPALGALLPHGRHAVMTFRAGYPTDEALASPRRPAREVVLS